LKKLTRLEEYILNHHRNFFELKFKEARRFLDEGLPYWTDDFVRPYGEKFAEYLKHEGYDIYHLYFITGFATKDYEPFKLREISVKRATERELSVPKSALSLE